MQSENTRKTYIIPSIAGYQLTQRSLQNTLYLMIISGICRKNMSSVRMQLDANIHVTSQYEYFYKEIF